MTTHSSKVSLHHRLHIRNMAGIALLGIMVALTVASPAQASHRVAIGGGGYRSGITIRIGSRAPTHELRKSHAEFEFERGFDRGACDGAAEGWQDGLYGRRFCDDPKICLDRESRHFARGYQVGYSKAYRDAFEKGKCERLSRKDRRDRHDRGWRGQHGRGWQGGRRH